MASPKSQFTLKSGLDAASQIVPGESPEAFAQLQAEYYEQFPPANAEQRFLVDQLIRNEWLLRRYHRVEAQLWQYQARLCENAGGLELGEAFSKAATTFQRLSRRTAAVEKAHKEALAALKSLLHPPQPPEPKSTTEQLGSFLNSGSETLDNFAFEQFGRMIQQNLPGSSGTDGREASSVKS